MKTCFTFYKFSEQNFVNVEFVLVLGADTKPIWTLISYTDDELVVVGKHVSEKFVQAVVQRKLFGFENFVSGSSCEPVRASSVVISS
jgi:hypothetical protein